MLRARKRRTLTRPSITALLETTGDGVATQALGVHLHAHVAHTIAWIEEPAAQDVLTRLAAIPDVRIHRLSPVSRLAQYRHLLAHAPTEWALVLGEEEWPSDALLDALPKLTNDPASTHYRLPTPRGYESRLIRMIPAIATTRDRTLTTRGPGRILDLPIGHEPPRNGTTPATADPTPVQHHANPHDLWIDRDLVSEAYAARIEPFETDLRFEPRGGRVLHVTVHNDGPQTWPGAGDGPPHINLSYRWLDADNTTVVVPEGLRTPLPGPIGPHEHAIVALSVAAPETGRYVLQIDLVAEHVRWFDTPLDLPATVGDP